MTPPYVIEGKYGVVGIVNTEDEAREWQMDTPIMNSVSYREVNEEEAERIKAENKFIKNK